MKAAILRSADSIPVYGDFDEPAAGQDSQIVGLVAAGIHQLTRSVAAGRHYGRDPVFPVIPGLNAVARTDAGQLVFSASGPPPYGTLAERFASPGGMRFALPAGARPEAVAAGVNPGMASWLPLKARQAEAGKLGTVLILGVTGTSGFLAVQNARLLGSARVIGAGRRRPALDRAAAAGAGPAPSPPPRSRLRSRPTSSSSRTARCRCRTGRSRSRTSARPGPLPLNPGPASFSSRAERRLRPGRVVGSHAPGGGVRW